MKFQPATGPETPYQRARQAFDDLIGNARMQAANWRMACFGCLALLFIAIVGLIWVSLKVRVVPYIIEVNQEGAVNVVARAEQTYQPSLAAVKYFVSQFVTWVRSIPVDPVVLRQNFLNSYNFVTPKGRNTLNAYAQEQDPFKKLGQKAVSVELSSVVKLSETSYQAMWTEQEYSSSGAPVTKKAYTGVFNLEFRTPKDERTLFANPLGVYVDFFNISQVN
ncbi:MAG: conjugal transfer protein TrbF [Syntrophorhabdales bacterium]|jgi:type IV secretion system protein VirB5